MLMERLINQVCLLKEWQLIVFFADTQSRNYGRRDVAT